jgi:hypothetical protein
VVPDFVPLVTSPRLLHDAERLEAA